MKNALDCVKADQTLRKKNSELEEIEIETTSNEAQKKKGFLK